MLSIQLTKFPLITITFGTSQTWQFLQILIIQKQFRAKRYQQLINNFH